MMPHHGLCEFCGEEVGGRDPFQRPAARGVKGWEPLRKDGGANHIIGREPIPNAIAHKACAEREYETRRRGIGPNQEALL